MRVIEYGVREFINLALKAGGLGGEFTPRGRAVMGTAAHTQLTARRPEEYQREFPIRHTFDWQDFRLVIRGRIDGVLRQDGITLLEEIKSTFLPLGLVDPQRNPYHLAQLQLYHHFLCRQFPSERIVPTLTYVHPETIEERSFALNWTPEESQQFFESLAVSLLESEAARQKWRAIRNESIKRLRFPFDNLRPGQAELIGTVERCLTAKQDLLVEAATGIGKTLGVLYPAIVNLPKRRGYSRIFFLTAKTAGVEIVRKSLALLRDQGLRLRVLYLQAKERICPLAGSSRPECGEGYCPYADDFYAKVERLLPDLLEEEEMTPEMISAVAEREMLCPFELSLELALHADLIVCDYNYAFDPLIVLRRFFAPGLPHDNLLLVDEAHNMVTRGREMYSTTLLEEQLTAINRVYRASHHALGHHLESLLRQFAAWRQEMELEGSNALRLPGLPENVMRDAEGVLDTAGELLMTLPRGEFRRQLLDFYPEMIRFHQIALSVTPDYAVYVEGDRRYLKFRLLCLHPGPLLQARLQAAVAGIFFSGTLSPARYYRELLGVRDGCAHLALPSPFPPEHRLYLHVPDVSTKYRAREATRPTVAQVVMTVARAQQGNYLAFFPSYNYLGAVWAEIMVERPDDLKIYAQKPGMSPAEQAEFLRKVCVEGGEKTNLGLAVMGGLFGEAIDLPGDRLIGAVIVGPGLPGVSLEQELIREYYDETRHDEGFYYAYLVPGLTRVIQAAGRVFRTPADRGVVALIDDRFLEDPYRDLLPPDWQAQDPGFSTDDYRSVLEWFWKSG